MTHWRGRLVGLLAIVVIAVGCPGPTAPAPTTSVSEAPRPVAAPKRITIAIQGDPVAVMPVAELGGASVPGTEPLRDLVAAGLTNYTNAGLRAQLAEAVPTFENGLWKVFPDGHMETSWRLRADAKWHDGTPVTVDDLLFTAQVVRDKELTNFRDVLYDLLDTVEAVDDRTVVARWKSPFIEADTMFSGGRAIPLPKHLLEKPYLEQKATLMQLPYWSDTYVGNGPFKLRDWTRGSQLTLDANLDFVLGRPRVDEIEVRFIPDRAALMANFLAGTVELSLSRGLAVDEAVEVSQRWQDGQVLYGFVSNAYVIYPQFLNPSPTVVGDVRFRRALLHAIDRQQMIDTFMAGKTSVMHTFLNAGQPEFQEIERTVPHFDYDPRRAMQIIEELGYQRGPDGQFRDSASQPLAVELRNFGVGGQATVTVANFWQAVGVPTEVVIIPEQRSRDNEYRATFPGFQLLQQPNDLRALPRLHSREAPLPENRFVASGNKARYINPEFDALLDKYYVTIPKLERTQVLGQIIHHIAEQMNVMGLFYSLQPNLVSNRLLNVTAATSDGTQAWNAEQWDVK